MRIDEHMDQLAAEGILLAEAAEEAGLAAAVPGCPSWQVRDLVTHLGGVHRWATAIVGGALADDDEEHSGRQVGTGPPDDQLIGWFRDGHRALLAALRAAPRDLACFTFLPAASPLAFWARRQALETAIHRADAQAAAGGVTPFDHALALDGVDEILTGFAARYRRFEPGTLRIEPAGGPSWLVAFGPERLTAVRSGGEEQPADATVSGSATDVYMWLWNRPAEVSVTGEAGVAQQWRRVRVRWG